MIRFLKRWWWLLPLGSVLSYPVAFCLVCLLNGPAWDFRPLLDSRTYALWGILTGFCLLGLLFFYSDNYWVFHAKGVMEGNAGDGDLRTLMEQARFETPEEVQRNFHCAKWKDLGKDPKAKGAIVSACRNPKGQLVAVFAKPSHSMVIGTTGSGKTTTYVSPCIQIYSETETKPSMLISDPKGELYALHADALRKRSYEVKVLDLRNPYLSVRWNPLARPFAMYQESLGLREKAKPDGKDPKTGEPKWLFEGMSLVGDKALADAIQVRRQELRDSVYEDLNDIATAICPVTSKNDPIWEKGAKTFILAIMLAMLEDSENPALGMTADKYNFYTVTKIATSTDDGCAELNRYFSGRPVLSQAVALSKQVLGAGDKTRASYLSTVFDKLAMFSDESICALTSANEIDLGGMGDKPIALFLQIPDEKETRHALASLFVLQAYKELVRKANESPDLTLKRPVHFILDEFGNLPQVNKLSQMVTVGRSRNIWLSLVVQSYAQLANVYGDKAADIIKSNCNVQVFIGTTDQKTKEEFSKQCGNRPIIERSASYSSSRGNDLSVSSSVHERPLIYPSELSMLNPPGKMGNAIVTVFGYYPIRAVFTPSFLAKDCYLLGKALDRNRPPRPFDEEKAFYDMRKRNAAVLGSDGDGDSEDGDAKAGYGGFAAQGATASYASRMGQRAEAADGGAGAFGRPAFRKPAKPKPDGGETIRLKEGPYKGFDAEFPIGIAALQACFARTAESENGDADADAGAETDADANAVDGSDAIDDGEHADDDSNDIGTQEGKLRAIRESAVGFVDRNANGVSDQDEDLDGDGIDDADDAYVDYGSIPESKGGFGPELRKPKAESPGRESQGKASGNDGPDIGADEIPTDDADGEDESDGETDGTPGRKDWDGDESD